MRKKVKTADEALVDVRDALGVPGCEIVGDRLVGPRVGADAAILATVGWSGSSLYWRHGKAKDEITVLGASERRNYRTVMRSQPYTANAKTGEWPIAKIVARITEATATRKAEDEKFDAYQAEKRATEDRFAGARQAVRDCPVAMRLSLGDSPSVLVDRVTPEQVLAIVRALS